MLVERLDVNKYVKEVGRDKWYPKSCMSNIDDRLTMLQSYDKSLMTNYSVLRDILITCIPVDENGTPYSVLIDYQYRNMSNELLWHFIMNRTESYGEQLLSERGHIKYEFNRVDSLIGNYFIEDKNKIYMLKDKIIKPYEIRKLLIMEHVTLNGKIIPVHHPDKYDGIPGLYLDPDGTYVIRTVREE